MPNTSNDDVIIVGSLSDKELRDSIDKLVDYVGDKTTIMAGKFDVAMEKMKSAMKDFAITQKVSVDLMQDAWKQMSASFDAMLKAQQNATSSGNNSGAGGKPNGTPITELRNNISVVEQEIQAVEKKTAAWRASRDEIILMKNALRAYRADVKTYEHRQNTGEVLSKTDLMLYEDAKKKVEKLTSELKELWAKRGNIPAPSKEDLQKYDELQRKLAELKKSLNNAMTPETVGDLEKQISVEERYRKKMELGTQELRNQNQLIAEQKAQLKDELMTEEEKKKAIEKQNDALERQKAKQLKNAQSSYLYNFNKANTESSKDIASAEQKLRNLKKAVDDMRKSGLFDEVKLNKAQKAIDTLEQKIERMRSKRPMSMRDVLGMDESSVDAIAKKMAALKKVTVDPQNTAQVKQLGDEYQRLKRLQAELMGQNIQMTHSNNYLAQSFGYIRNRLVYAMTLGAITSFTKQVYEIRGQYELLERSLGVLVNSFERGSRIFQELNQMAIESPFTLMELAGAAKQLTAYNFAANEVVDTTRRLADISAALGVPMERLTYNLGQIRAQTVLTARDARDFANAGLPIVASLAEHFTELEGKIVTTGDVYDRMSKKMVSYSDVMSVLNKMTDEGGKFFEFQAKQAETLRVQMANLNLAWNNMLNDIGKSNQGLLTLPISGLKALLQNWQTIDRVLKSMLYTFIGWKALQMVAIRQQWAWATATGATAKQMGWLANGIKAVGASLKALFLNPWTWVFVGIMAVIDLVRQTNAAREAMHELNQEIRDNANEASESMLNYLNNKGNKSTLELAKQNKLTAEQGERAWESLKQQIEQSALSANGLIAELLAIEDVNERVRVGFDYAERIQKAQAALQDLKDDSIEVNTDVGWFGMFGEGLVSDLKDYADYIEKYSEIARKNQMAGEVAAEWMHQVGIVKGARQEFLEELDDTAESINNFIRAYNITDPLQINEILERVRSQIKAKNPEIKGEAAKIFDISLDQKMAELTNGAVDRNASLWNMFMERLKHNSSSAFQDINDDWIKNNEALSSEQQAAVDANLQYFKDSMPYAYQAVSEMVADASKLKIHIGIAFNVQQLSDFQKEVNKRIGNSVGALDFGGGAFLPTNNDNLSSWVKVQQQAIKSLGEENKRYALDDSQWSKEKIAANDREIQQRKNLLDLFHQQYAEEKKGRKGGNRKPEDVVAEALKQELQLIREMQSNYDKLRKSGVSNMDAIDLASKGYEATIIRINQVLSKFGIDKFNAANFAGKDVRSLLQSLEEQRKALLASGKVKTSSLQALDVEIQKLTVDAKTYDMKKVTDGLNSELGKIKDEYELAIELDANPELGGMFKEMFDIGTSAFPRTINEYMQRVQQEFDNARLNLNLGAPLNVFRANTEKWYKWGEAVGYSKEQVDDFKKSFDGAVGVAKKWAQDTVRQTQDLQYKLADNNGKIAIEEEKLANLRIRLANEVNDEQKRLLELQIQDQQNAIAKLKEELLQLLPTYQRVFGEVAEHSAWMTRKLAKDYKTMLVEGQKRGLNPDNTYSVRDPITGQIARITKERMGKEIKNADKELQKTQSTVKKITEAFKKGEDGVVDWVHGVELVGEELGKLGQFVDVVGNIADAFGNPNEYNETAEAIHDISTSLQGASTAAQGIGQFASGDYIGGATNVLSGAFTAISAWMDNSDKKIQQQIKNSERAIKKLELAYIDLEHAISNAYGTATIGAQRAAIANKELQLAELRRQLALEESRKSKDRDTDRIIELQKQIKELEYDIKDTTKEIVNSLLGITSVGNAAEELVSSMISAFRNGEKFMDEFQQSFDDMIDNMVMKSIVGKVIGDRLEKMFEQVEAKVKERAENILVSHNYVYDTPDWVNDYTKTAKEWHDDLMKEYESGKYTEKGKEAIKRALDRINKIMEQSDAITPSDVEDVRNMANGWKDNVKAEFQMWMDAFGIKYGQDSNKGLSALQQGIAGVTEETASAVEAYLNGMSQQAYLRNDMLVQIRDTIMSFDMDVQLGTLSQMLLQLQQSYQVQQNIESILTGVLNPSGRAIVVELNS